MTFDDILKRYRDEASSNAALGTSFEKLMQRFMQTYPEYLDKFSVVWRWSEFPYKNQISNTDIGIDLVAKTHSGEFWAIQCKCFQEDARISKNDVDTFLSTSSRFFYVDEVKTHFSNRLWIATTNLWNENAAKTITNQTPPVSRIGLAELQSVPIDWAELENGKVGKKAILNERQLREHQIEAISKTHEHFKNHDRGKLIMACGTGKTFTSLKIAENEVSEGGIVLFLVPSIALLAQTLLEWSTFAEKSINPICVCSDKTVSKADDDISNVDLALPATTDKENLINQLKNAPKDSLTVIFSTYQSIDVVSKAQKDFNFDINLIICDEAHRTASYAKAGNIEKIPDFVKVHENNFIKAQKRLYMTATPKLYTDSAKDKAKENDLLLWSMDNPEIFGEEIYRLDFGTAVKKNLLSDYKVIVLTVSDEQISPRLKEIINDKNESELQTDDASKLIGCINALSKRVTRESKYMIENDPGFMHTAVAFCADIKSSAHITRIFNDYQSLYRDDLSDDERNKIVNLKSDHVDGKMNAAERKSKIAWLKDVSNDRDSKECHILTNARCLSEGVDVPSLDAIIFLSTRKSQIDVVQAVGRVMRRAPGKSFGYVIIPVVLATGANPEDVLNDKKGKFKVVWDILNALRAHDSRFNAMINKIDLNNDTEGKIIIDTPPDRDGGDVAVQQLTLHFDDWKNALLAKIVEKVGDRHYWETWGKDVAEIAERHTTRINELIETDESHKKDFEKFLSSLHKNINPSVTREDAIDMLAQHLITRPVFEALFGSNEFIEKNFVSKSMQKMLSRLDEDGLVKEREKLEGVYNSVRQRCEGINNAAAKMKIINELYERFFKAALPKTVGKLGIVYTPVEVVDFILNSVNDVLKKEFDCSLSTPGVKILDPFSGTGTFLARLIQSGLIRDENLDEKYQNDLNANEIVLLAYYISCINIENAYHERRGSENYKSFDKMCLTDTFQLGEDGGMDTLDDEIFAENSKQVQNQKKIKDLKVIVGNPPYSVGQKSANDNAQNESYKNLENRIAKTYVANTNATNKNSIYDSYIKAFRWASDRIDNGVIGFVTNAGWLDGAAMDGLRKCFEEEFTSIYVFNLRGNQRTQGELSRKEGGKIFGSGSRAPISIAILVKNGNQKPNSAKIYYTEVDDYLSRDEKLSTLVNLKSILSEKNKRTLIKPNTKHDWINQRGDSFDKMIILGNKKDKLINEKVFCDVYSRGISTSRDAWCYNFNKYVLENNIQRTINYYNSTDKDNIIYDSTKFSWDRQQKFDIAHGKKYHYDEKNIFESMYRPFCKQWIYFSRELNNCVYQIPKLFPTGREENLLICISALTKKDFSVLISDKIVDLHFNGDTQCFPLYYYEPPTEDDLFAQDKMLRHDGITDYIFKRANMIYGGNVTKEDIFYYVYGFLHLHTYREQFANELKKSLPRLILVPETEKFWQLSKAGRALAEIHLNYENQEPPQEVIVEGIEHNNFKVQKMKLSADKTTLIFNSFIKIKNLPPRSFEYIVNGRSPLEWIIDRYQVKVDKASGIENNPNLWCEEHGDPKYIFNLILSLITVSLKTLDIIDSLPEVEFT